MLLQTFRLFAITYMVVLFANRGKLTKLKTQFRSKHKSTLFLLSGMRHIE